MGDPNKSKHKGSRKLHNGQHARREQVQSKTQHALAWPRNSGAATPGSFRSKAEEAFSKYLSQVDERLYRYSQQITADQLHLTMRVIRSFFTYETITKTDLRVSGVMEFFTGYAERASLAEQQQHSTMLPLLWKSEEELNELDKRFAVPE